MVCYIYKVRPGSYVSKKDNKEHKGLNVGLLSLEGSSFALESFIDSRENQNVFQMKNFDVSKDFKPGFYEVDIDEFPVYVPQGTQYQKKIIAFWKKFQTLEEVKCYLDI